MEKIPILILHGWNLSASKFSPLLKELIQRGFGVYCPDLPGFGTTIQPKNSLYLSDYLKFVRDFLNKQKVNKIVLIGHSFGGRIGIKFASENPEFLQALVLTGTPGINPVPKTKILLFLFLSKIGNAIFSIPFLSIFKNTVRHLLYKLASATDFYNTDKKMRETFKNIVREDLRPYLSKISVPTLLLWGGNDMIVPIKIAKEMANLVKKAKLSIILAARHSVPWTHPRQFADEVERFVKNL